MTATAALPLAKDFSLTKDIVSIFKLRIAVAIMMSAVGGAAITPGAMPDAWRLTILALAVFLASASAGAFNQWAEADLDRQMKRTASRPFAAGRFRAGGPWLTAILGLLGIAIVMAAWSANWWAAFHTFMGAFVYGIIYTVWLKRRSWTNIVVGGLAGSFAVLAGAAAVHPGLQAEPLILSLVLFLWTPPHFWSLAIAAHDDYASASVPMLPVVCGDALTAKVILAHTAALVSLSLLPALWSMGMIYLAGAAAGGALFMWTSIRLVQAPSRKRAIQNFLASLLQLVLLLSGTVADRIIGSM
jgi:protoheme IX farnesyltransferase